MQISPTSPALRTATPGDAPRLAALALQVWLHTYATNGVSEPIAQYVLQTFTPEKFSALIKDPDHCLWLAEQNGNVLGFTTLNHNAPHAGASSEIETLYVQAHFLRCGLGARLLNHAREQLQQKTGSNAVWLKVNAQNQRAIDFYLAQGFTHESDTDFILDGVAYKNWVMVAT